MQAMARPGAIAYVLCALFVLVAPGAFSVIMASWFHASGGSLSLTGPVAVTPSGLLVGLASFTLTCWFVGLGWAAAYNRIDRLAEAGRRSPGFYPAFADG
jgi:hypothetical protein